MRGRAGVPLKPVEAEDVAASVHAVWFELVVAHSRPKGVAVAEKSTLGGAGRGGAIGRCGRTGSAERALGQGMCVGGWEGAGVWAW